MPRAVTVVIPIHNGWEVLEKCLESCKRWITPIHRVLIVDDASDEPRLREHILEAIADAPHFQYERQDRNLGFVQTCNRAVFVLDETENDILLLNSDTIVTEGFLEEMRECLYACDRHGVCCPRSDNATILTVPGPQSYERWRVLREHLPRFHLLPTGVGFCMLIRRSLVRMYGLFDEIYGRGYCEENDFCSRIGYHGYSTIAANQAFVFHAGGQSFPSAERAALEKKNNVILRKRYPAYWSSVKDYLRWHRGAAEHFAQHIGRRERPSFPIELSHLPAAYNGTSEYALELLRHLTLLLQQQCDVRVIINRPASEFFGIPFSPTVLSMKQAETTSFDLLFVPHQIFRIDHLTLLNRLSPRIALTVHDDIILRCQHMRTPELEYAFRLVMRFADGIIAISEEGRDTLARYLDATGGLLPEHRVIVHGMDIPAPTADADFPIDLPARFALAVGNAFAHKRMREAVDALSGVLPLVILGNRTEAGDDVVHLRSGYLSQAQIGTLYRRCAFVIYPSSYESFGLPVLHSALHGKAVIAADLPHYAELERIFGTGPYLRRFRSVPELRRIAQELWSDPPSMVPLHPTRSWRACAEETATFLQEILARPITGALEERFTMLQTIDAAQEARAKERLIHQIHRRIGHGLDRWPRSKRVLRKMMRGA